jgi:hypothetical protein
MENKTYEKIYRETSDPVALRIIRACDCFMAVEAYNTASEVGGVEMQKVLYLNALVLAGLTRDKVDFTKSIYDKLQKNNLHSANAYYLSPTDDFFLRTPRYAI